MSIITDIQSLEPGALVHLYEFEYSNGTFAYFSPYNKADGTGIQLQDYSDYASGTVRTYNPLPIEISGLETKQSGPIARPEITISLATDISTATTSTSFKLRLGNDFDSILGKKMIRRTTLAKYIKGGASYPGDTSAPIEFSRQVWIFERIREFNKVGIKYELVSPFDLDGITLPKRQVVGNACPWVYQGASPDYTEANKKGGCSWHRNGTLSQYSSSGYTSYTVYVNQDDEYLVPSTTSFTAHTTSLSISENDFISTSGTADRINEDGSVTTGVSVTNYWQAKASGTGASNSLGTPTDANTNYERIRVYSATHNTSTTYYAFTDDKYNDYVKSASTVWKVKRTNTNVTPGYNVQWQRGDSCGKRLTSCNKRFNFNPITAGSSSSLQKHNPTRDKVLPFGGFPGSQRYS
jgi:lambda family phage minor tail protein L